MLRLPLLYLLFLATMIAGLAPAVAQTQPLGWTPKRSAIWSEVRATDVGGWFSKLNSHPVNDPGGFRWAMLHRITGDPAYALLAWQDFDHYCGYNYRPGNCDVNWSGMCTSNCSRDRFVRAALVYSLVADALPPMDKANFKDVLTLWTDQSFGAAPAPIPGTGVRVTDSDELVGNYFGLVLFALAIEIEDPVLSAHILQHGPVPGSGTVDATLALGGVDATGSNRNTTMRNAIRWYLERANGEWVESSRYNLGTVSAYIAIGIDAVNGHFGEDKFPEFDAQAYMNVALALLTPDLQDRPKFGDVQAPHRGLYRYRYVPFIGALAYLADDPVGQYVFDDVVARNGSSALPDEFLWWANPIAPRSAPSGPQAFLQGDATFAWVTHRSGWAPGDSHFSSLMSGYSFTDHDPRVLSNFGLYRDGGWVIANPVGYYSGLNEAEIYSNNVLLGGIGATMREAFGQSESASGDGWVLHSGLTAGNQKSNGADAPPREWVHEYQRSIVHLHNGDDSDTIVLHERVASCDWLNDPSCMECWRINRLDSLTKLRGCGGDCTSGTCAPWADGKHRWLLHTHEPTTVDALDPDLRHWTPKGGQSEVYWKTFLPAYSVSQHSAVAVHDAGPPWYAGGLFDLSELADFHRSVLVPDQVSGFQTWLNVLHTGGAFTATRMTGTGALEDVEGVHLEVGGTDQVLLFNSTENTPPAPSSVNAPVCPGPDGYCVIHNDERFEQTRALRRFKVGLEVDITTVENTRALVFDLDPSRPWEAWIDGAPLSGFNV